VAPANSARFQTAQRANETNDGGTSEEHADRLIGGSRSEERGKARE